MGGGQSWGVKEMYNTHTTLTLDKHSDTPRIRVHSLPISTYKNTTSTSQSPSLPTHSVVGHHQLSAKPQFAFNYFRQFAECQSRDDSLSA